jgi:hypothetical protein
VSRRRTRAIRALTSGEEGVIDGRFGTSPTLKASRLQDGNSAVTTPSEARPRTASAEPLEASLSHRRLTALALASLLAVCLLAVVGLGSASAATPAEDHLVVSDIPNATTSQAVTLERITGAGAADGSAWALPTTASGSNKPFTLEGDSSAVGALALSGNGRYISLAGTTSPVGGAANAAEPRDVARVNAEGEIDTSTVLGATFEEEKIRGAVTNDGSSFWVTGNGNGNGTPLGGMIYAPIGHTSTPTVIVSKELPSTSTNKALNNFRTVQLVGGSLWTGSEKGTAGIYKVTGLPTAPTVPTTPITLAEKEEEEDPISELPLESVPGSGNVDTMYVVRQEKSGKKEHAVGAILKYALVGGTWTLEGKILGRFVAITGEVVGLEEFRLYVIAEVEESAGVFRTKIERLVDKSANTAGPNVTEQEPIATAPTGTNFRGISFAPQKASSGVPAEPTGLAGVAKDGAVELSWTAPTLPSGSPVTGYVVTPYLGGVAQTSVSTGSTATTKTVSGLTDGTAYTFRVAAVNSAGTGGISLATGPLTPEPASGAPTPTITLAAPNLEGTNGDPTNPTDSVTVAQTGTPAANLTVTAISSSNNAVAEASGVAVSGSGATRTVSVTPKGGVGYAEITLQVEGAEGKKQTAVLRYAASAPAPNAADARFLTGAADASATIPVGGGYFIAGDDENNILRLYAPGVSGAPVKTWDFTSSIGTEEIDIEAATRSGNTIYWTGSMGNSKKGNLKPERSTLFSTTVSGTGATTELTFGGYYLGLRNDLIAWDEANGNRFGFKTGAEMGKVPKEIAGFNVEGLEMVQGSTSEAFIGFRAPLVPATPGGKALVVPVTNINELATRSPNTTTKATFGTPLLWNLGGLSIREISKNENGEYLIIAGSYSAIGEFALYKWDGIAADQPVRLLTQLPGETGEPGAEDPGSWESIVEVPTPIATGSIVQLVMDNGSTNYYGDGLEAKTLAPELEKDRTEPFTIKLPTKPMATMPPEATGSATVGSTLSCSSGTWTGEPTPTFAYGWERNGIAIVGAEANTYVLKSEDEGNSVRCEVTATNTAGSTNEISNSIQVDAKPVNTLAPEATGGVTAGSTLTCTPGTWTGRPTPTFAYAWQDDGVAISGAESNTYVIASTDEGNSVRCVVTATNAAGSTSQASNEVKVDLKPHAMLMPEATGAKTVGSTLTCLPGTWTGEPAPTFTYEWQREGAAISGAEEATYMTTSTDEGKSITCVVTGTNAAGSTTATSAAVKIDTKPGATAAPVASGGTAVGSTLTCAPGTWTGEPTPTLSYAWQREGVAISGAESATYVTTTADEGKSITCVVTGTNEAGSATATSNAIAVATASTGGGGGGGGGTTTTTPPATTPPASTPPSTPLPPSPPAPGGNGGGNPTPKVESPSGPVAPQGDQAKVGTVGCGSSSCTVTAGSATLTIDGKKVDVKVKVQKQIGAGKSAPVTVMLPKAVREELKDGKAATVKIQVKVKNAAGKTVTETLTVRIKSKGK